MHHAGVRYLSDPIQGGGVPDNKITFNDITSFVAPTRRFNTSPGDSNYDRRWDLVPGKGVSAHDINLRRGAIGVPGNAQQSACV